MTRLWRWLASLAIPDEAWGWESDDEWHPEPPPYRPDLRLIHPSWEKALPPAPRVCPDAPSWVNR